MRLTIERIRTLVLATGVLLIAVLAVFLAVDKWKAPFNRRDIPKRLGIDIQQEANSVTYTQAHGGHTIFKIHAARVVQLRNQQATLHDVVIELYGQNGTSVDRIRGNEFEYDQKTEVATAAGPVEITLMRPAPAAGAHAKSVRPSAAGKDNEIHVKTSGLVFNQRTGIASTDQQVNFSSLEGSGSAIGASYDSDSGLLILDRAVELTTRQGASPVEIRAQHAEFDRNAETGQLRGATAETRGEQVSAAQALLMFRDDGSVERLNASGGLTLATAAGAHLAAPRGSMEFNQENQPRSAFFAGGVTMRSASDGRTVSGTAPAMTLAFNSTGELRHAHLERGVEMRSLEQSESPANGQPAAVKIRRTWRSAVADIDFRQAGAGQVEPAEVRGTGGVVLTGETQRGNQAPLPSRLAADEVTGEFGPKSTLTSMTGIGHARLEETTATGAQQTATGQRLKASFAEQVAKPSGENLGTRRAAVSVAPQPTQIQSAELDGNVALVEQAAIKPGAQAQPPLRATAGRAVYEAAGQWLHLTLSPRIEDGGMELTARRIDVAEQSSNAFAHGDVKATWIEAAGPGAAGASGAPGSAGANDIALGGKGPVHAVAAEAELYQPTGKTSFSGHARLWRQDDSISAPRIVLFRQSQTLIANTANPAEAVIVVMLSAASGPANSTNKPAAQPAKLSVVRVSGGDLWYSGVERKAVMRAYPLPSVRAQSNGVASTSAQVELLLAPSGAAKQAPGAEPAQVERMNAIGHVVLTSQDRRGTGEKLVYSSQSGDYVLTGTATAPPRLTDPERGSVTGAALIFNSRNDSVRIEGSGHPTTTETTAPDR